MYWKSRVADLKEATIIISLVRECVNVDNCDIEKEIKKELSQQLSIIPWAQEIKSVAVN